MLEAVLGVLVGVSLSAACGFRIFVPLLVASIAANTGQIALAESFQWVGSPVAIAAFSVATIVEVAAYYIPWVDNLLDTLAGPAAVIAGILVSASFMTIDSPMLKWSLAIIAGGGAAGAVQAGTTLVRAASTVTTGGLGNPVVSTVEAASATAVSLAAILIGAIAGVIILTLLIYVGWRLLRRKRQPEPTVDVS